jgi:hypothetical protein
MMCIAAMDRSDDPFNRIRSVDIRSRRRAGRLMERFCKRHNNGKWKPDLAQREGQL